MRHLLALSLFSSSLFLACGDKDGDDTGSPGDGGAADGGGADGGTADGGTTDGGTTDGGTTDGGTADGGTTDGGTSDGGTAASLYDQLGGEAGVNAVLDAFITNVVADAEISWMFAHADGASLKSSLHDQICEVAGGGCTYAGPDMATLHANMAITDDQWNALVGDLLAALDSLGVPYTADFSGGLPADQLVLALAGMYPDIVTDPKGTSVYFNQLGGYAAVVAVVDGMVANVAVDARINGYFAKADIDDLKAKLVDQICEATGGYCTYTGLSMADAHAGMCISNFHFDALVEDLLMALDTLGVPYSAKLDGSGLADALLLALEGMRTDIVETCPPTAL